MIIIIVIIVRFIVEANAILFYFNFKPYKEKKIVDTDLLQSIIYIIYCYAKYDDCDDCS